MEEVGRVVEVHGDLAGVEFTAKEACATCGARVICHHGVGDRVFVNASNEKGAKVGDLVRVQVDPKRSLLTGVLLFIVPIVVFIFGFLIMKTTTRAEVYGILGGILSLVAYFFVLRRLERWVARRGSFRPIVREIIESKDV